MAFVVRIRCHAAARVLENQPRYRLHDVFGVDFQKRGEMYAFAANDPWTDEGIRELANRYANRQLATLERDAQILACWGQTHAGAEA
jgi:hypothetical protein